MKRLHAIFTFLLIQILLFPVHGVKQPKPSKGQLKGNKMERDSSSSIGAIKRGYHWYLHQCTYNPIPTKSITAACIATTGDFMSQKLEAHLAEKPFVLDQIRLKTFFLCGLVYVGPFIHRYYDLLASFARWLNTKYMATNKQQIIGQLCLDQTLGVAIFFPLYFYVYECLESLVKWTTPSFSRAHSKCLEQIKDVVLMQYRLYPLANIINFGYVPEQLRVLFSNTVSVFWNIYLCSVIS